MGLCGHLCCHSYVMAARLFVPAAQECTTGGGFVFQPALLLVCGSLQLFALFGLMPRDTRRQSFLFRLD